MPPDAGRATRDAANTTRDERLRALSPRTAQVLAGSLRNPRRCGCLWLGAPARAGCLHTLRGKCQARSGGVRRPSRPEVLWHRVA